MNRSSKLFLFAVMACLLVYGSIHAMELKSGYEFISEEAREMQDDEFMNPGYAMVERGSEMFAS
jgi:sulfur-oxidizing protein SoxA